MKNTHFISTETTLKFRKVIHRCRPVTIWKLICLLFILSGFVSCEKVIQLDLKNSTPHVVIQGNIYDQPGPYVVQISSSVNFDASSVYPPVTGANVVISDNLGQSEKLTESLPGNYVTAKLRGIPGRTYSLSVTTGTDTYKATSVMPKPVSPDSIYFASSPFSGELATMVKLTDSPFTIDYYRFVYFINAKQQKIFYVLDDELFQGATIRYTLFSRGSDIKLAKGDQVTVWLETIDHGVFEYFRTAGSDEGASASPANPVSNITNGALGYFNACAVRKVSATVGH
jgi:hypothetical protein